MNGSDRIKDESLQINIVTLNICFLHHHQVLPLGDRFQFVWVRLGNHFLKRVRCKMFKPRTELKAVLHTSHVTHVGKPSLSLGLGNMCRTRQCPTFPVAALSYERNYKTCEKRVTHDILTYTKQTFWVGGESSEIRIPVFLHPWGFRPAPQQLSWDRRIRLLLCSCPRRAGKTSLFLHLSPFRPVNNGDTTNTWWLTHYTFSSHPTGRQRFTTSCHISQVLY